MVDIYNLSDKENKQNRQESVLTYPS